METDIKLLHVVVYKGDFIVTHQPKCIGVKRKRQTKVRTMTTKTQGNKSNSHSALPCIA